MIIYLHVPGYTSPPVRTNIHINTHYSLNTSLSLPAYYYYYYIVLSSDSHGSVFILNPSRNKNYLTQQICFSKYVISILSVCSLTNQPILKVYLPTPNIYICNIFSINANKTQKAICQTLQIAEHKSKHTNEIHHHQ
jgi:hypothetical protein